MKAQCLKNSIRSKVDRSMKVQCLKKSIRSKIDQGSEVKFSVLKTVLEGK